MNKRQTLKALKYIEKQEPTEATENAKFALKVELALLKTRATEEDFNNINKRLLKLSMLTDKQVFHIDDIQAQYN